MLLILINHPTPAFTLVSKADPEERIFLGNVYRQTMPVSLARVAAIIEAEIGLDVNILDLKALDPDRETVYKQVDLGDRFAIVTRIGAEFEKARDAILSSDWIGFSNHFTFESGIIRDLIHYARTIKPSVKILVGGADAKARPHYYVAAGADIVFRGDVDPAALVEHDWSEPRIVENYRFPFTALSPDHSSAFWNGCPKARRWVAPTARYGGAGGLRGQVRSGARRPGVYGGNLTVRAASTARLSW